MERTRFLRKQQRASGRPLSGWSRRARRSTALAAPIAAFKDRISGASTGPATLFSGIRGSAHAKGLLLWAAALATGILCVWEHIYAARLASEIEILREARGRLETEIGFLDMECVALSSRERIEAYASEHLGMRYPDRDEVVRLSDGPQYGVDESDYVMREERAQTGG
ncbi:cell division protein FtsL [bacterium]|nr:cell division protein FtsL [bacterium]